MQFIDLAEQQRQTLSDGRSLRDHINSRIAGVLDHGRYILGPEVEELEVRLAKYVGVEHCIAVASGTDALLIALMALGIKPGDEVIQHRSHLSLPLKRLDYWVRFRCMWISTL